MTGNAIAAFITVVFVVLIALGEILERIDNGTQKRNDVSKR